jgi:hypothetical protein
VLLWLDAPEECETGFALAGLEGFGACVCCTACFFGFFAFGTEVVVIACVVVGVEVVMIGHAPVVSP